MAGHRYGLSVSSVGLTSGSFWGGVVLNVTGAGFVPTDPTASAGKVMSITHTSGGPAGVRYNVTLLYASTTELRLSVRRWFDASITPVKSTVAFTVRIWDQVHKPF